MSQRLLTEDFERRKNRRNEVLEGDMRKKRVVQELSFQKMQTYESNLNSLYTTHQTVSARLGEQLKELQDTEKNLLDSLNQVLEVQNQAQQGLKSSISQKAVTWEPAEDAVSRHDEYEKRYPVFSKVKHSPIKAPLFQDS